MVNKIIKKYIISIKKSNNNGTNKRRNIIS